MPLVRVLGRRPLVAFGGHEPWRRFVLIVGVILVALPLLAHASPPDPLWIRGLYDGADFDDVVVSVVAAAGLAGCTLPILVKPVVIVAGMLPPNDPASASAGLSPAFSIRAPPRS